MKYTDEEIEMLARFESEVDGGDIAGQRFYVKQALAGRSDAPWADRIRAAARLMRAAREQGAAEMRERAASIARDNGGDVLGVDAMIRALTIPRDG